MDFKDKDKKMAAIRGKLKKGDDLKKMDSKPDIKQEAKQVDANNKIYTILKDFKKTQVPIKKSNLKSIIDLATKNKITLPADALAGLYANKQNVSQFITYIDERLVNFFQAKKLVPPPGDDLFKVRMLNLCVKIKKDKLKFEDAEIKQTKQFDDFDSLKEACKSYIWNVKINECAILNTIDADEFKLRYNKTIDRVCTIANVPITNPLKGDESAASEEGVEGSGESGEQTTEESDGGGGESSGGESGGGESGGGESGGESSGGESGGESTEGGEQNEGFFNGNIISNDNFTESDYNYIIATTLFIFSLFFIYLRYKK
jgi:hypothetical protein